MILAAPQLASSLEDAYVWQERCEKQQQLEEQSFARGAERFRLRVDAANSKGIATAEGGARSLMRRGVAPLTEAIRYWVEDKTAAKAGRKPAALKWIQAVGPEVAAYITVRTSLDRIWQQKRLVSTLAMEVSGRIIDELRYRRYQEQQPNDYRYRVRQFNTTSYAHMTRSLTWSLGQAGVDISDLSPSNKERSLLGVRLIDLLVQSTGLVEVQRAHQRNSAGRVKGWDVTLVPTAETLEWVERRNGVLEELSPLRLPMVIPPLPWSADQRGGYAFALRGSEGLVRRRRNASASPSEGADLPIVHRALNAIQDTPWKINGDVLAMCREIRERGEALAGIPAYEPIPLPPRPHDIDTNEEARKEWKKATKRVHSDNAERRGKVIVSREALAVAEQFADEPSIWFPHTLDFRGRVYPLPQGLHPQGSDVSKALLKFAHGEPLGERGVYWLAIHGANCLGVSPLDGTKVSRMTLEERRDLAMGLTDRVLEAVDNPWSNRWWAEADEPLQFYAWMCEWARYIRSGEGEDYVCSLPVSLDGSCNGLQHFAAMFRDEETGAAVNLTPNERPADVYTDVSLAVLDLLTAAAVDYPEARWWLKSGLVNRKLCKTPTMTFGYGSKTFGFSQQINEYVRGLPEYPQISATLKEAGLSLGYATKFLAAQIWKALGTIVPGAFAGMAWLQRCATMVCRTGEPVEWQVPVTGFRVRQEYWQYQSERITTKLLGGTYMPRVNYQPVGVDARKQRNAVSPNVIHSLDAAALMLTVTAASSDGVACFAAIHDSYGTLPCHTDLLARATRQAFVELYSQPIAADLYRQLLAQIPEEQQGKCPPPPEPGSLDVSAVLASSYFFS